MVLENNDTPVPGEQPAAETAKPARPKRQPVGPTQAALAASNNVLAAFALTQPDETSAPKAPKASRPKSVSGPAPQAAKKAKPKSEPEVVESRGRGRPKNDEETVAMSIRVPASLVSWLGDKARARFDVRQRNVSVQQVAIDLLTEQMRAETPVKKGRKNG